MLINSISSLKDNSYDSYIKYVKDYNKKYNPLELYNRYCVYMDNVIKYINYT